MLVFLVCTICVCVINMPNEGVPFVLFVCVFPYRLVGVGAVTTSGFISGQHQHTSEKKARRENGGKATGCRRSEAMRRV